MAICQGRDSQIWPLANWTGYVRLAVGKPVGEVLRELRERRGLTLQQVHLRSHGTIDPSTLSKVENGRRPPSPEFLRALAPILKADVTQLYRLAGHLPTDGQGDTAIAEEPEPRDPKSLVRWLRGDATLTDDDRRVIADVYERLRRRQE